jgi:hypothetical protein
MAKIASDVNSRPIQVPTGRRIAPEAPFTVDSIVNKTVEQYELIEIISKGAGCIAKFKTATDTDDVTTANNDIEVLPNTNYFYQAPFGSTQISLLELGGTATVTLIRR